MPDQHLKRLPLEVFIKRSWPLLAVGAVFILGVSAGLLWYALSDKTPQAEVSASSTAFGIEQVTSSQSLLVPRALDGIAVTSTESTLQVYAVMVENSPEARPLSGPARANITIEAPVEGGITRFLLLFDATTTADQIGPVRSARPYFVDWANGLGAVYAHVGGSPEALQKISSLSGFRNVDEFFLAKYFWRSGKRIAPHNVYTRMDLLRAVKDNKAWSDGAFQSWKYDTATSSLAATSTAVAYPIINIPYGGTFNVTWMYNPDTQSYTRKQGGFVQQDADGVTVTSTNVVVLLTDAQVTDNVGRLKMRTTGKGKAWLYRQGQKTELQWSRNAGEWLSFTTIDGQPALFSPGKTWISVMTSAAMTPQDKP